MEVTPRSGPEPGVPRLGLAWETIGSTSIISADGELDIASCPRFGAHINEVLRAMPSQILIDLSGVEFVDSTGLSVLLNARRQAMRNGIPLKLVCDVPQTLRLLDLTRLRSDFDIYRSREQALEAEKWTVHPPSKTSSRRGHHSLTPVRRSRSA